MLTATSLSTQEASGTIAQTGRSPPFSFHLKQICSLRRTSDLEQGVARHVETEFQFSIKYSLRALNRRDQNIERSGLIKWSKLNVFRVSFGLLSASHSLELFLQRKSGFLHSPVISGTLFVVEVYRLVESRDSCPTYLITSFSHIPSSPTA